MSNPPTADHASMLFYLLRENIGLINYTTKDNKDWGSLNPDAKKKFQTFASLVRQLKSVDDLDIEITGKKDPPEWAEWRKQIFQHLKEKRTYKLTTGQRAGEAKTMSWLFRQDYTPNQIIKAFDTMYLEPFWSDKPLTLMTVAKQIGAMLSKSGDGEHILNPDKFKNQKFSDIIQS